MVDVNSFIACRGALIRMKLRKVDPFRPIELARKAQGMFVEANKAIQE